MSVETYLHVEGCVSRDTSIFSKYKTVKRCLSFELCSRRQQTSGLKPSKCLLVVIESNGYHELLISSLAPPYVPSSPFLLSVFHTLSSSLPTHPPTSA
jgi:hypothetical protein